MHWVLPDLAIGGSFPPDKTEVLAGEHGVGAVVDLREEDRDDEAGLVANGIRFLHLPTPDTVGVSQNRLDQGVAFARMAASARWKLLIHCEHGIGRSALLALCVMVDRGHAPMDALLLAKDARSLVSPSLSQYEAWALWMRRCSTMRAPHFDDFAAVAYRHLATQA